MFTGDEWGAGTDANIFLNLYGENGDTGERELKDSSTNINKFERNKVSYDDNMIMLTARVKFSDIYVVSCNVIEIEIYVGWVYSLILLV